MVDQTPGPDYAFRGLIGLDRATLEERERVPTPDGGSIADIAVAPDGTVYGSDPVGGVVYSLMPGASRIRVAVARGVLRSPQGIAVSEDGERLYISDYRYGIAMVYGREVYQLETDLPILLDGVDGLWRHGNELIAVRNGGSPMQIVALTLSPDGLRVVAHRVIESDVPEWTEPLGGNVADGRLYYVANGQWDRFGPGGVVVDGGTPEPTVIRSLPLSAPFGASGAESP